MTESTAVNGPLPGTAEDEERRRRRRRKFLLLFLLLAGFILLLGLAIWYLLFRQPIPIPQLPGEVVMPGYATAIYGAERPMGVAVSRDGSRVYLGETAGEGIARMFDAGGTEIARLEPPISTGASHLPVYLAVHPTSGEVYVTDRPTGSIYIYSSEGQYQRTFNPGPTLTGWQPLGMTFDAEGKLYVTDVSTRPQAVLVFDTAGTLVATLGKTAGFDFPNGVAVDANGLVYVTDGNNGRLIVLDINDQVVAQVGRGAGAGNLGLPRGIAIDDQGRLYVGDATGQAVYVYATVKPGENRLEYLGTFGTMGAENGAFRFPNGVAVDGEGRVYVADSGNDRVQVWSY